MLQKAATLELTPEEFGLTVRVVNETGHKLPSGYPEGRRVWLNVQAFDEFGTKVFESGAYDLSTATLIEDPQARIYEIHPGLSPALAQILGLPAGKSFHFVLNDTIFSDDRIPPRGFTNAGFAAVQSPPVAHAYADGQYWDDASYQLPVSAVTAVATLYYQSTSREYVEFLRDENHTNSAGQDLYDAWVAQGMCAPVAMVSEQTTVQITQDVTQDGPVEVRELRLLPNFPNPFEGSTAFSLELPAAGPVRIAVHDVSGRRVCLLADGPRKAGRHDFRWDGRDDTGEAAGTGLYFIRCRAAGQELQQRALLLR